MKVTSSYDGRYVYKAKLYLNIHDKHQVQDNQRPYVSVLWPHGLHSVNAQLMDIFLRRTMTRFAV